eukprot:gene23378-27827_t
MKLKSHPLLQATQGTHRHVDSEHYGAMGASRKIYIQAALHADETPALLVAAHLRRQLVELENANRLNAQYIMGAPSGRFELGSGRNYNRGFPVPYQAIADKIEHLLGQDIDANRQLIRQAWGECLLDAAPLDEFQSLQRTLMLLAHDADI